MLLILEHLKSNEIRSFVVVLGLMRIEGIELWAQRVESTRLKETQVIRGL